METFVLRIWVPGAETAGPVDALPIRGTVEHVSSGGWVTFRDDGELLGLIRDFLQQREAERVRPS